MASYSATILSNGIFVIQNPGTVRRGAFNSESIFDRHSTVRYPAEGFKVHHIAYLNTETGNG